MAHPRYIGVMTPGNPTHDSTPQAPPLPADVPEFPVHIAAPDISLFLPGNTGIPGFTTRDSGRPGPHVMLVSLIHGNEIAGAAVLAQMLRGNFTPLRGRVTFGFANLDAFARFDAANPLASRFVEEDLNRVWDDAQLFGVRQSVELERARAMRPLIDTADILLDLHTMLWPSDAVLLCGPTAHGRELALALADPPVVVADNGHAGGKRLIDYAHFTCPSSRAQGILVEAGQHWEQAAITQLRATVAALLRHAGLMDGAAEQSRAAFAQVTHTVTARTHRFSFVRNFRGGEIIAKAGSLIAHDGEEEIRTPYDSCMLVMPSLKASCGHTAVRLARSA